jgi:hypothetical protein
MVIGTGTGGKVTKQAVGYIINGVVPPTPTTISGTPRMSLNGRIITLTFSQNLPFTANNAPYGLTTYVGRNCTFANRNNPRICNPKGNATYTVQGRNIIITLAANNVLRGENVLVVSGGQYFTFSSVSVRK